MGIIQVAKRQSQIQLFSARAIQSAYACFSKAQTVLLVNKRIQ